MMTSEGIRIDPHGSIWVLIIDRPERRNALDQATAHALEAAIDRFEADDSARVAVITGASGIFCAGADLKSAGDLPRTGRRGWLGIVEEPPTKPTIAAVEGFAVGGGLELCLACDLIVAAADARFGLPEPRRGLLALAGGLLRLPRRLPYHVAMELALTGRYATAAELQPYGFPNRTTSPGGALDGALELAKEVTLCGPRATRATARIVRECAGLAEADAWEHQQPILDANIGSEEAREGIRAFIEKRPPAWGEA